MESWRERGIGQTGDCGRRAAGLRIQVKCSSLPRFFPLLAAGQPRQKFRRRAGLVLGSPENLLSRGGSIVAHAGSGCDPMNRVVVGRILAATRNA
jgi:hypothetical protein